MQTLALASTSTCLLATSTRTATSRCLARSGMSQRRTISSSSPRYSFVGTRPIAIPPDITLERVRLSTPKPDGSGSEEAAESASSTEERIVVRGKNGETSIRSQGFFRFLLPEASKEMKEQIKVKRRHPPCPKEATADPFTIPGPEGVPTEPTTATPLEIALFVENPDSKAQRQAWGTTRTLISNAIKGQTEGYTLPIFLIGVGYRAALEVDQSTPVASVPTVMVSPAITTTSVETYPRRRLVMRLGYSRVIYVAVPEDIKVTVPAPTIIVLWGRSDQRVGQFAADIRSLRKPEVYKGKGVFVGDEKIKMKVGKKK